MFVCRHCQRRCPRTYRGGLCWRCRSDAAARALYPVDPCRRHSAGHSTGENTTPPGTAERVAIYEGRVARHRQVFHPNDAVISDQ